MTDGKNLVAAVLEDADGQRFAVRVNGHVPVETKDVQSILGPIAILDELSYQASRLYQLNRLFGDDYPRQLRPDQLRAWSRQAKRVLEASLCEIVTWKTQYAEVLHLLPSGIAEAPDLNSRTMYLESELGKLEATVRHLRQASSF